MEKYGFVYIWYDRKHKRYYIGSHWGTINDGYICSSPWMKQGYKHRPLDFKRRILKIYVSRENLLDEEYKWLSKILPIELGKKYYNLTNHHPEHWMMRGEYSPEKHGMFKKKHTEEAKKKMRGRKVSDNTKEKLRKSAIEQFSNPENRKKAGFANVGIRRNNKKPSEEAKKKMSLARKGKIPWNKGKTGLQKHSEETKLKMQKAQYYRYYGEIE